MYAFEVDALDRRDVRCPVQAKGRLRIGWGKWVDCDIRDISNNGARLVVPDGVYLPRQLVLTSDLFEGKKTCTRRWESGGAAGVEFLEPLS